MFPVLKVTQFHVGSVLTVLKLSEYNITELNTE